MLTPREANAQLETWDLIWLKKAEGFWENSHITCSIGQFVSGKDSPE